MGHDLAGEINSVKNEIRATCRAIKRAKSDVEKHELMTKLDRLESRLDELESRRNK